MLSFTPTFCLRFLSSVFNVPFSLISACYLTLCMSANLIAVLWSVIAVRAFFRPPPKGINMHWVTKIANFLGKITFVGKRDRYDSRDSVVHNVPV